MREITLLGQNVNAYHGEGRDGASWSLGRLIDALSEIDGLERIRYTTSHPRDMDDELIAVHRDNSKLMPYLHLPVQSGSDRILEAMNRRHSADDYLRVIERIRAARPDIALSSDFIVGFPGETAADFEATLSLVRRGRIRPGLFVQILAPPRNARRRSGRPACRGGQGGTAPGASGRLERTTDRLQRIMRRAPHGYSLRPHRPPARPARRALSVPSGGSCRRA